MRDKSEKVVVGYCHPGMVHAAFHESLLDTLVYDVAFNRRIVDGGGRLGTQASANLSAPRNKIVREFLTKSTADWLWMLDTDMVFPPDTLERLLEFADPVKAPIVGGLCFSIDDGRLFPTLYGLVEGDPDPQVIRFNEWPPDAMFEVAATGTACLLMHRSALERMRDQQFNPAFPWFQETHHAGEPVGEDITFCWRASMLDIPVHVNTGVQIGHVKQHLLTIDGYLAQRGFLSPTQVEVGA